MVTLTSSVVTPPNSASAWVTARLSLSTVMSAWMRRTSVPSALVTSWILALPASSSVITTRASSTDAPSLGTSQTLPPSKSMPRLSPLANRLMIEITDTSRAMSRPQRKVLTKLKSLVLW